MWHVESMTTQFQTSPIITYIRPDGDGAPSALSQEAALKLHWLPVKKGLFRMGKLEVFFTNV